MIEGYQPRRASTTTWVILTSAGWSRSCEDDGAESMLRRIHTLDLRGQIYRSFLRLSDA